MLSLVSVIINEISGFLTQYFVILVKDGELEASFEMKEYFKYW